MRVWKGIFVGPAFHLHTASATVHFPIPFISEQACQRKTVTFLGVNVAGLAGLCYTRGHSYVESVERRAAETSSTHPTPHWVECYRVYRRAECSSVLECELSMYKAWDPHNKIKRRKNCLGFKCVWVYTDYLQMQKRREEKASTSCWKLFQLPRSYTLE